MFKNFKKNDKYFTIAVYSFLVVAALIGLIFIFINFGKITSFFKGLINTLMSFVYGFVIAYICNPIYKRLHKYVFKFIDKKKEHPKLRKGLSILLAYIIFFALITLLLFAIIPQIAGNIQDLGTNLQEYGQNFLNSLNGLLNKISTIFPGINPEEIIASIQQMLMGEGVGIISKVVNYILQNSGTILAVGTAFVSQVFAFFVGIILSIYFLIYKELMVARVKRILCSIFKKEGYERIINFARYTDDTFGRYLLGALLDSIIVGLVVYAILALIGYPLAPLIGVLVGITNIIPFFGPFLGGIPSALLILIHSDGGFMWALGFVAIIVVVQQIDGNIIAPHIHGSSTGLTPIGVILAVTVCSYVFGFVGMLIGVPLWAVVSYLFTILIENKLKKKKLPVNVDCYRAKDIYSDESFNKAKSAIEAQERVEHHETLEKVKAENKITEDVIHQVEERIVDEIINTVAEEIIHKAEEENKAEENNVSEEKSDENASNEVSDSDSDTSDVSNNDNDTNNE